MTDFYKITIEFATPPLLQTRDVYVRSLADVQRVRTEAGQNGYRVVRWEALLVDTPAEVTELVNAERRETAFAIGEGGRAEVVA